MNFNPKVKDFTEENKDLTLIGLYWAGYWRFTAVVILGYLAIWIAVVMVAFLIGFAIEIFL